MNDGSVGPCAVLSAALIDHALIVAEGLSSLGDNGKAVFGFDRD